MNFILILAIFSDFNIKIFYAEEYQFSNYTLSVVTEEEYFRVIL